MRWFSPSWVIRLAPDVGCRGGKSPSPEYLHRLFLEELHKPLFRMSGSPKTVGKVGSRGVGDPHPENSWIIQTPKGCGKVQSSQNLWWIYSHSASGDHLIAGSRIPCPQPPEVRGPGREVSRGFAVDDVALRGSAAAAGRGERPAVGPRSWGGWTSQHPRGVWKTMAIFVSG